MLGEIKNFFLTLRNSKVNSKCGHITRVKGRVKYYSPIYDGVEELSREIVLKLDENGEAELCTYCVQQSSIRCTWCGGSILPGEPITLTSPEEAGFMSLNQAISYEGSPDGKLRYIGCIRKQCSKDGKANGFLGRNRNVLKDRVYSSLKYLIWKHDYEFLRIILKELHPKRGCNSFFLATRV